MLDLVAPMVARRFSMAIIMPNTDPPITSKGAAQKYQREIEKVTQNKGWQFQPLMTLYLTDTLHPHTIEVSNNVYGVKYYPSGLTTNSNEGVKNPASLWTKGAWPYAALQACAQKGTVLMLHAADRVDVRGEELDPYEQEPHFIRETLPRIRDAHPNLKISVEHLSTAVGAEYIRTNGGPTLGCSITAQHLLLDRRDTHRGGLRPHMFWWPIIQSKEHKEEIRKLAAENHSFVWLGSDSAPHPVGKKETDCCAGGVLTAHAGIELYAQAFEDMSALDERFERFASTNGPTFFGLTPSNHTIGLFREPWKGQLMFATDAKEGEIVRPFMAGEKIRWTFVGNGDSGV